MEDVFRNWAFKLFQPVSFSHTVITDTKTFLNAFRKKEEDLIDFSDENHMMSRTNRLNSNLKIYLNIYNYRRQDKKTSRFDFLEKRLLMLLILLV